MLSREILDLAVEMTKKYYGKPLVLVGESQKIKDELEEYELSDEIVPHRLNVVIDGKEAFAVIGITVEATEWYSYEHAKEVFKEAVDDSVWDCLLINAMRAHMNTMVYPFVRDDDGSKSNA